MICPVPWPVICPVHGMALRRACHATERLPETRRMRFEEAYAGWRAGRLRQEESAQLLGVCERTLRRYIDRYEKDGLDGQIDRRLNQILHRRAPVDEVMALTNRYRQRHQVERPALLCLVLVPARRRDAQLQLGEVAPAGGPASAAGTQSRHASQAPRPGAAAGHAAARAPAPLYR